MQTSECVKFSKIKPVCEGTASNLREFEVVPDETLYVGQGKYAFGSPRLKGSRYLITDNVVTCIILTSHNSEGRVGFMAHLADSHEANAKNMKRATFAISPCEIVLFGGGLNFTRSTKLYARMEKFLVKHDKLGQVAGRDLFNLEKGRSETIGIDTETGKLFIPKISAFSDRQKLTLKYMLCFPSAYVGKSVAPESAFLKLVKRQSD